MKRLLKFTMVFTLLSFSNLLQATTFKQPYSLKKALATPARSLNLKNKYIASTKNLKRQKVGEARLPASATSGALVEINMTSEVGVMLADYPNEIKSRVVQTYMNKPTTFWEERARMQVETTLYRLVYRNFYYANKGQLPLPPVSQWNFTVGTPYLTNVDGHELVMVNYKFKSILLTSSDSPGISEPKLNTVGGNWDEAFVLPADPELILERTGFACMDEEDFPPNSVDSENARSFYDHICKGGSNGCHVTLPVPKESCNAALKANIGRVAAAMNFKRLAWDQALADFVRVGEAGRPGTDLSVVKKGIENNRLIYRYIPANSCSIAEGCVGGSGWRRLLQFDASVSNLGQAPAHLGEVENNSLLAQHNMFEFSACHGHNHFSHYGKFTYGRSGSQLGSKRAFCLESTSRYSNNESTPLNHPYSCHYQGIAAGWGDDYISGIECQWIDVTTVRAPSTAPLGFKSNPDQFICEGTPILDAQGNFTFEATTFTTESGAQVDRIACNFNDGWDDNNYQEVSKTIPADGSYITEACTRGQDTHRRNCGFSKQNNKLVCNPGQPVKLNCKVAAGGAPQALRVCDYSSKLETGVACTHREAFSSVAVTSAANVQVSFICPNSKDAEEPGGNYSIFTAPLHNADSVALVNCN